MCFFQSLFSVQIKEWTLHVAVLLQPGLSWLSYLVSLCWSVRKGQGERPEDGFDRWSTLASPLIPVQCELHFKSIVWLQARWLILFVLESHNSAKAHYWLLLQSRLSESLRQGCCVRLIGSTFFFWCCKLVLFLDTTFLRSNLGKIWGRLSTVLAAKHPTFD